MSEPEYEVTDIAAAPEVVVQALRDAIRTHGITEYAVVDHGHDMAAAGRPLAVIGRDSGHSAIVIRPMQTLLATAHHDLAERLTTVLRDVAAEARNTAEDGR